MKTFPIPALSRLKLTKADCEVTGCGRVTQWRGLCCTHYERQRRTGSTGGAIGPYASRGSGHARKDGRVMLTIRGKKKLQHIAIAEAALGKPLPPGAEVHHVDENPSNNAPGNLVICPSAAYHKLLHQRQRAFDACGHHDWRRCTFCKTYDAPANLSMNRKQAWHRECMAASKRNRKDIPCSN